MAYSVLCTRYTLAEMWPGRLCMDQAVPAVPSNRAELVVVGGTRRGTGVRSTSTVEKEISPLQGTFPCTTSPHDISPLSTTFRQRRSSLTPQLYSAPGRPRSFRYDVVDSVCCLLLSTRYASKPGCVLSRPRAVLPIFPTKPYPGNLVSARPSPGRRSDKSGIRSTHTK